MAARKHMWVQMEPLPVSDVFLLSCLVRAAACRRDGHSCDGHRFLWLHTGCKLPALVSFILHTLVLSGHWHGLIQEFSLPLLRFTCSRSPVLMFHSVWICASFIAAGSRMKQYNSKLNIFLLNSFLSCVCFCFSALTPGNSSSPFSRQSGSWWGPSSSRRTSLKRSKVRDEKNQNAKK